MCIYLARTSRLLYTPHRGHVVVVSYGPAPLLRLLGLESTDYCASLLERREPHGVSSSCGHSCVLCATVCPTVMPLFSEITEKEKKERKERKGKKERKERKKERQKEKERGSQNRGYSSTKIDVSAI